MKKESFLLYKPNKHLLKLKQEQKKQEQRELQRLERLDLMTDKARKLEGQYIEDIERKIKELEENQKEVLEAIDSIKNEDIKKVLQLKFIEGKTKEQIAKELYFSEMTVYRYMKKGLQELERG